MIFVKKIRTFYIARRVEVILPFAFLVFERTHFLSSKKIHYTKLATTGPQMGTEMDHIGPKMQSLGLSHWAHIATLAQSSVSLEVVPHGLEASAGEAQSRRAPRRPSKKPPAAAAAACEDEPPRAVVAGVGVRRRQHAAGRDRHRVAHRAHRQQAVGQQGVPTSCIVAVASNGGRTAAVVTAAVEEGDVELEQLVLVDVGDRRRPAGVVVGRRDALRLQSQRHVVITALSPARDMVSVRWGYI